MKNSVQIKDEKAQLKSACQSILDLCKAEIRDMSEEEGKTYNENIAKIKGLNEELRDLEKELNKPENKMDNKVEFRLLSAIRDIANNREMDEAAKAVCERGLSEMRKAGVSFSGQIQLPIEERADVSIANDNGIVGTDIAGIIAPLRTKNVLVEAGARFLTGLVGDCQLPVMGAGNVSWEGETDSAKDAGYSFAAVKLSPKRLTAYVDVSKQFLNQDSVSAEMLIREDLINAINSKLEQTILGAEAGDTTKPAGIFYNGGSALTDITNYKGVAKLESQVDAANTLGDKRYIVGLGAKATLRTTGKSASGDGMILTNGEIDGTPVYATSNVGSLNVAYGDFSMLAIGQWGAIKRVA